MLNMKNDDKINLYLSAIKQNIPEEIILAHEHASLRSDIEKSTDCACFYCFSHFKANDITEWVNKNSETALCSVCSVDAVLGDASGFKLDDTFLKEMHRYWF